MSNELIGDALRYVVSHEVGHCLGFMHNMSASSHIPTDSLRSATFTKKYGTTTSIMDYARFNYIAQPEDSLKGLSLTPPRYGEYDEFLIKYNYAPIDEDDVLAEYAILSDWVSETSKNPVLRFGKQQLSNVQDPRTQSEDLGDDAIKSSTYGVKNLKYILSHMDEWLAKEDDDYSYRKTIYKEIISQYSRYIVHVNNIVGGIYLYESYVGDAVEPSYSIPSQNQREALAFVLNTLDDFEWLDNEELLSKFYPMETPASQTMSDYVMRLLLDAPGRCELASTRTDDPFTPQECMELVFNKIWGGLKEGEALTMQEMRRQIYYLENFADKADVELSASNKRDLSLSEQSAYYEQGALYYENSLLTSDYYDYLLKIEKLLKKGTRNKDDRTAAHCRSLLSKLVL